MIELTQLTCGECGCVFGLNTYHYNALRGENGSFKCPNGHSRHYTGETDADKIKRLQRWLSEEQDHTSTLDTQNRRLKTQVKNLKKKVP